MLFVFFTRICAANETEVFAFRNVSISYRFRFWKNRRRKLMIHELKPNALENRISQRNSEIVDCVFLCGFFCPFVRKWNLVFVCSRRKCKWCYRFLQGFDVIWISIRDQMKEYDESRIRTCLHDAKLENFLFYIVFRPRIQFWPYNEKYQNGSCRSMSVIWRRCFFLATGML